MSYSLQFSQIALSEPIKDLTKRESYFFFFLIEDVGTAGTIVAATWMKIDHRVPIGTGECGTATRDALDAGSDRHAS